MWRFVADRRTTSGKPYCEAETPDGIARFAYGAGSVELRIQPPVPSPEAMGAQAARNAEAAEAFVRYCRSAPSPDVSGATYEGTWFHCACCGQDMAFGDARTQNARVIDGLVRGRVPSVRALALCAECYRYVHDLEDDPGFAHVVRVYRLPTAEELLTLPPGMLNDQARMVLSVLSARLAPPG